MVFTLATIVIRLVAIVDAIPKLAKPEPISKPQEEPEAPPKRVRKRTNRNERNKRIRLASRMCQFVE